MVVITYSCAYMSCFMRYLQWHNQGTLKFVASSPIFREFSVTKKVKCTFFRKLRALTVLGRVSITGFVLLFKCYRPPANVRELAQILHVNFLCNRAFIKKLGSLQHKSVFWWLKHPIHYILHKPTRVNKTKHHGLLKMFRLHTNRSLTFVDKVVNESISITNKESNSTDFNFAANLTLIISSMAISGVGCGNIYLLL